MEAKFEDYWEELRNEIISELPSYGNMPQEGIDWIERVNNIYNKQYIKSLIFKKNFKKRIEE